MILLCHCSPLRWIHNTISATNGCKIGLGLTLYVIISCILWVELLMSRYLRLRTAPRNLGSSSVVGNTTESIFSEYQEGNPPTNTYPLLWRSPKAKESLSLLSECPPPPPASLGLFLKPFDRKVRLFRSTAKVVSAPFFTIKTECHSWWASQLRVMTWPPRPQLYLQTTKFEDQYNINSIIQSWFTLT